MRSSLKQGVFNAKRVPAHSTTEATSIHGLDLDFCIDEERGQNKKEQDHEIEHYRCYQ